ncbi:MAG TPA: hypothetical protein VNZ05_04735 [Solirubrobacteraceae bacterium]|jgi:hypothetical protein|nr:hypothetical protein [Solirubrobacteraceae bacterium]
MRNRAHRTLAITLALALAGSAVALAGPLGGHTYEGGAPSYGRNSEGQHARTHASGNVVLRVSSNGRSVRVWFSSSSPVLYCNTQEQIRVQSAHPASISSSGTFKAADGERFRAGPGAPAITQVITGRFSGGSVRGTIHTYTAPECSGVASFSARAR